eukprot:TRINITY_DN1171_c0_g1_i6.p1 TRINITY_DN1171_c0_g1~~TRINITY_DN1171_c0_g1_i6.p1  ORF type:complete len:1360 (+),score=408.94 TRINITY_DN1171_c0_g1_i6:168-4247(+)
MLRSLVGSEMCIRDRYQRRVRGFNCISMSDRTSISFYLNGALKTIKSGQFSSRTTLLQYLRDHEGLTGTKASCTQGGCGACNVTLSYVDKVSGKTSYRSVNACLRPLLSMDGKAVTTTEGIGSAAAGYHPVQERIAGCNGVQCGFCTPGQVMALYSFLRDKGSDPISQSELESRFDGNICRCTGYRPIITAAASFATDGTPEFSEDIVGKPADDFKPYDPATEAAAPDFAALPAGCAQLEDDEGVRWCKVDSLDGVGKALEGRDPTTSRFIVGGTMSGIYRPDLDSQTFVDISAIPELHTVAQTDEALTVGANTSIADLSALLASSADKSQSYLSLHQHMQKIASWNVRNAGSWAGNLVMAREKNFASDLATIFMGANATLNVLLDGAPTALTMEDFLWLPDLPANFVVLSISLPVCGPSEYLFTFRQALRYVNAHALLNAAFRASLDGTVVKSCSLALGCAKEHAFFLDEAQSFLTGKDLADAGTLSGVLGLMGSVDLEPELQYHSTIQPAGKDAYRASQLQAFMFKFVVKLAQQAGITVDTSLAEAAPAGPDNHSAYATPVKGKQVWNPPPLPEKHPGLLPIIKPDAQQLAAGEAKFTDDVANHPGTLFAAFACATQAHSKLTSASTDKAKAMPGVVQIIDASVLSAVGVPPEQFCNSIVPGETPVFLEVGKESLFQGQGIALVVANSRREAEDAARVIEASLEFEAATDAGVFTMADAREAPPERTGGIAYDPTPAVAGDVEGAWDGCATIAEGTVVLGGQSHFAMEKHSTYCIPEEGGMYLVYCATQMPDAAHTFASVVLGVPKNKVTMITRRSGGGFGAKLTGAFAVTMAACLASKFSGKPVKIQNSISVDMQMAGNCRHPMEAKFKIGCDADGKILAYDVNTEIDGGCANDFSGFVVGEVKDNLENAYAIPNLSSKVTCYKTDTAPNTAVRGPGLAQTTAITEFAIDALAAKHGIDSSEMRLKNVMTADNNKTCSGGAVADVSVREMADRLMVSSDYQARKAAVAEFNATHKWKKRGIEVQPLRYGHTHAFSAGTTVQVNINASDGSVTVWHTGAEIGQGLNAKLTTAVASNLGISPDAVQVREVNTSVLPNAAITGGSIMSESVVKAANDACNTLLERLAPLREFMTQTNGDELPANPMMSGGQFAALQGSGPTGQEPTWLQLCTFSNGSFMPFDVHTNLSANGFYVIEGRNNLDFVKAPLTPGAKTCGFKIGHGLVDYFSCGIAAIEAEVDCLTGAKTIVRADLIQDTGNSLNPNVDIGQTEGAFVMGLGFMLQEESLIGTDGFNQGHDTWEYKPCLNGDIPREFNVELANLGAPKNLSLIHISEPTRLLSISYAVFCLKKKKKKQRKTEN